MKKSNFLIIALLIVSIVTLSACQSTRSPDSSKVKEMALNSDKRIGIIQSLGGAHVSSQATHILRMENGKTLFLKSDVIDLANAKYSGKTVEVGGAILRTTDGNEVMTVMNIDLIDRETDSSEDLPQWLDYSSENMQISLKYRDDYKLQEEAGKTTLTKTEKPKEDADASPAPVVGSGAGSEKKAATIVIKIVSREASYNLLEAMGVASDSTPDLLSKGYNKSKITQKALDAYKQAKADGTEINYFIKAGFSYELSFVAGDSATLITDQNMFYDVLASIDFGGVTGNAGESVLSNENNGDNLAASETDQDVENSRMGIADESTITGFQKFSSEAMKFTIQYPKTYYFSNSSSSNSAALKSYLFSNKPLEDNTGDKIYLDVVKGKMPSGTAVDLGGKKAFVNKTGGNVEVYVEWSDGKYFQLTAVANDEGIVKQMASSLVY